ncbi:MAG: COX15/CtaA family protein [Rubrivivax sp.]
MNPQPLYDLAPLLHIALLGAILALGPLSWLWLRQRNADPARRLHALTVLALFLTFDLVLFGAFTRLTDSGLGCPDWPGCYGNASPFGAREHIDAAVQAMPYGPVNHAKAWIEMSHRYFATAVGVLITVLALASWRGARQGGGRISPWWATATLAWVILQGAFGALTVTMKLYPAIVTLHLLAGLVLLALLTVQSELRSNATLGLGRRLRRGLAWVAGASFVQMALGGWVSTNYAVLACTEFPRCHGQWWPPMDFRAGFALLRELGMGHGGAALSFEALTAIHYAHRLGAYVVLASMAWLAWRLQREGPATQCWAAAVGALAAWQLGTGLANVLLGWPLAAAVAHTGGAAAWTVLLTLLLTRSRAARPVGAAAVAVRRSVYGSKVGPAS